MIEDNVSQKILYNSKLLNYNVVPYYSSPFKVLISNYKMYFSDVFNP